MTYSSPPYVATWLAQYPQPQQRFGVLVNAVPILDAEQASKFAAWQAAADNVKDASAVLARYNTDVRDGEREADPGEEKRHRLAISQAQEAALTAEAVVTRFTRISHGSRVALDRTIKLVTSLAQEPADLELVKPVKLPKGPPAEVIAVQRDVLAGLDDDTLGVERALPPQDEMLARAMSELSAEQARGKLRVNASGNIVWPQYTTEALPAVGSSPVKITDAAAMIAWLFADKLTADLEDAVADRYRDVPPEQQLTSLEKRKRLTAIKARRFEAELVEVEAIFAAWREGRADVGLRPDVDPMAVLGVRAWKKGKPRESSIAYVRVN